MRTPSVITGRQVDGRTVRLDLADGRIAAITPINDEVDQWILPGLVDLQVNGYAGHDVNADNPQPETLALLASALRGRGTTRFCPTVITGSRAEITDRLRAVAAAVRGDRSLARSIAGIHLEGPYLSSADGARGAHDHDQVRDPDLGELEEWIEAADGLLSIVTLAPERPGSVEAIGRLVANGIRVSIGHTSAEPDQVRAAVDAGATLSTHLGNGIPAVLPRHPNVIWSQLADDRLTPGLIADGHHLPAETFTSLVRAKGSGGAFLVSDSVALAGCAPGTYETPVGGDVEITASGRVELAGTGLLAGSGACLWECLAWATRMTPTPVADLVAMATTVPSMIIEGLAGIEVGAPADLLLINDLNDDSRAIFTAPRPDAVLISGSTVP